MIKLKIETLQLTWSFILTRSGNVLRAFRILDTLLSLIVHSTNSLLEGLNIFFVLFIWTLTLYNIINFTHSFEMGTTQICLAVQFLCCANIFL